MAAVCPAAESQGLQAGEVSLRSTASVAYKGAATETKAPRAKTISGVMDGGRAAAAAPAFTVVSRSLRPPTKGTATTEQAATAAPAASRPTSSPAKAGGQPAAPASVATSYTESYAETAAQEIAADETKRPTKARTATTATSGRKHDFPGAERAPTGATAISAAQAQASPNFGGKTTYAAHKTSSFVRRPEGQTRPTTKSLPHFLTPAQTRPKDAVAAFASSTLTPTPSDAFPPTGTTI